jgi:hypothetical protein
MERKYLNAWKKFLDENTESAVEDIDEDLNEQDPAKPKTYKAKWYRDQEDKKKEKEAPDPNEE